MKIYRSTSFILLVAEYSIGKIPIDKFPSICKICAGSIFQKGFVGSFLNLFPSKNFALFRNN